MYTVHKSPQFTPCLVCVCSYKNICISRMCGECGFFSLLWHVFALLTNARVHAANIQSKANSQLWIHNREKVRKTAARDIERWKEGKTLQQQTRHRGWLRQTHTAHRNRWYVKRINQCWIKLPTCFHASSCVLCLCAPCLAHKATIAVNEPTRSK